MEIRKKHKEAGKKRKMPRVLDTLPNGFPKTESGVEIKLLKKIFSPEQEQAVPIGQTENSRSDAGEKAPEQL